MNRPCGALVHGIAFWDGMKPDPILTVSQWADEHRMLSNKASAEPGKWRTSRTPYLREIMDCLSSTSPIERVVFMKGAQVGGTECGNNWIGYVVDHAPGPMMAVQPTVEMAKRNSKQRIAPLIEESPRLKEKVQETRSRDSSNTILAKEFPGGLLVMTGANSAVGLRSLPARYIFLDEVDAYPGDVDGEGDPVFLAHARTRTFARRKIFEVSTPTLAGRSRIEAAYEESDQRRYYVPCPYCDQFQHLKWSQVKWPEGQPHEVTYVCEFCEKHIFEHHKTKMFERGEWRPEKPGTANGKLAGFHINSLYSPVGWFSWRDAVQMFLRAKGKPELLRGFVNTVLGETWKDKGDAPDWRRIYDKRETYKQNLIPTSVYFLTAGVDVQKDRLEVEIVGWGKDKQSWSIDYRIIAGETSTDDPWLELDKVLAESWPLEGNNGQMHIRMLAIDSGFNTQRVYNWARQHPISKVMVIKGMDTASLLVGQPTLIDVTVAGRKIKRGLRLWPVGVSLAKNELYSWLKLEKPIGDQTFQHGYCHFPEYGEEYFKQLVGEQLVVKVIRGFRRYEWEKIRDRNEALDCRVYARAAAMACGMDRFKDEQWDALAVGPKSPQEKPKDGEKRKDDFEKQNPRRRESFW